jgi:hypothetical protein
MFKRYLMAVITYMGEKDQPRARTGARGFTLPTGALMLESSVATEVSPEILKQLEANPIFISLQTLGIVTVKRAVGEPTVSISENQTDANLKKK